MLSGYSFRPRAWAAALAAAGCAAGIALGQWQSGRAAEKEAAAAQQKSVTLRGEFLERYTVLLDNKLNRGRPGYHVVQPLRLGAALHDEGALDAGRLAGDPFRVPGSSGNLSVECDRRLQGDVRTTRFDVLGEPNI